MTHRPNQPIDVRLLIRADQPNLLQGLDQWLELGLLSDAQVRQLCREYLTCKLPEAIASRVPAANVSTEIATAQFAEPPPKPGRPSAAIASTKRPTPPEPTLLARMLQSFVAEISVVWLLFLGVFLVVVSSGALAASQWKNFSTVGQYAILLGYTLAFWGASIWVGRQAQLQLTARMLRIATLLIIPVNFWMIDGLRLWRSSAGWGVAAIAALSLTLVSLQLIGSETQIAPFDRRLRQINSVGLSWLHWGWAFPGYPLIATYLGTIGTAFCLFYQAERQDRTNQSAPPPANAPPDAAWNPLSQSNIAIAFATLLLVARAVLLAQVPVNRLGLALGVCGWLLCWLSRRSLSRIIWGQVGAVLLALGWLAAITATPPWQAILVSGLAIWLLADLLQRYARSRDLSLMFLVGLQVFWLVRSTVPPDIRLRIVEALSQVAGSEGMPYALFGVVVVPYLWLMLWLATKLRQQQPVLAHQAELLALCLGGGLTTLCLENSLLRSLNLFASALTLIWVVRHRHQVTTPLLSLTHLTAIAAIFSWIQFSLPELDDLAWSGILLAAMAVEWSFCLNINDHPRWQQNAWGFGLVMSGLSYWLLVTRLEFDPAWSLMWLAVPALLTHLGSSDLQVPRSPTAIWLSVLALFLIQPLTFSSLIPRLLSLGTASLLMVLNTQQLAKQDAPKNLLASTVITIGFFLGFAAAVLQEIFDPMRGRLLVNLLAIAIWGLWLLRLGLLRRVNPLRQNYALAANGWAIALCSLNLLILTFYSLSFYTPWNTFQWEFLLATGLTLAAIAFQLWQHPTNLGFYGLGWSGELLLALLVVADHRSQMTLAIANLGAGLLTQVSGDAWIRRRRQEYFTSWHVIPLGYAALGLGLSHQAFTATTGLYTLAFALVGLGVGRRLPQLKPLTYLSLLAASIGAYELLVYQLMQVQGGNAGDGITLLAGLAAVLTLGYRLLARWLSPALRLLPSELRAIAHLHWLLGSGLAFVALSSSLSPQGGNLWMGFIAVLAGYALSLGRVSANSRGSEPSPKQLESAETWTYAGILQAIALLSYGLHRIVPDTALLLGWAGAIASVISLFINSLPWLRWGWLPRPWKVSALLLPGFVIILTSPSVLLQSLLIAAAVYAWFAKEREQVRLSYLSIFLLNWAILKFLNQQNWLEIIWVGLVVGGSLLYITEVDPALQPSTAREQRHRLRSLATGLICLTAFYQSETEPTEAALLGMNLLTILLSLGFILAGLLLRVRAFLYIGTLTFVIKVLRQLWLFLSSYPQLLWAGGIAFGLILLWIAATFESRRNRVQNWLLELQDWQ